MVIQTIINGNLTLQDTIGSFVITPSGTITASNTTLNNLIVFWHYSILIRVTVKLCPVPTFLTTRIVRWT